MKESDKGTVKEAVFMMEGLVDHRSIKPNGLGDCAATNMADGHTGGTGLCFLVCVSVFYSLVSIWVTKLDGTLNEEVDNSFGKFVRVRRQSVCLYAFRRKEKGEIRLEAA